MRPNSIIITCVLIILFFPACDTGKKNSEETPTKRNSANTEKNVFSYEIKKISEKLSSCTDGECTRMEINYPVFKNKTHESINQTVENHLKSTLSDFIMEADGDEELSVLVNMFLQSYQQFKKSFPESKTPWYVECDVIVSATTPDYISLAFNTSSYTGGAHTNTYIDYVNLSPKGEKLDDLEYFFESTEKLQKLAEDQFRQKYKLAPDDSLSEKGFIFDNDEFALSENFGFTESAVIFYYNSYEIAPYVQGPTALLIPLINLKEIYKF